MPKKRLPKQALWHVGQGKHRKTAGMFAVWTCPALLDIVEQVIHDDKEYRKTKIFILQIVRVMDEIDPEYNYSVAKAYYQMAKDAYGAT